MEGIVATAKKLVNKLNVLQMEEMDNRKKILRVIYTIKPITILEYCSGIFNFRLKNGELRPPNWIMKAAAVFCTLFCTVVYLNNFLAPPKQGKGRVLKEIPSIAILTHFITSSLKPCANAYSMLNIRIFTTFANLDEMLLVDKYKEYYRNSRFQTNILVSVLLITHGANYIFHIMNENDFFWAVVVFYLYLVQKLEITAFIKYIIMLKCRLNTINKCLSAFVVKQEQQQIVVFTVRNKKVESQNNYDFIGHASGSNVKIRDLATMYDIIGKICFMINEVFNWKIFMILVTAFGYIIITIRTALAYYQKPGYYTSDIVTVIIWCINAMCKISAFALVCEILLQERNKTKILVNKIIMNYDLPKTMRTQAKAFMELVEAWPLRIYVYDMFSVDITLILKFISVATTYLIVIIQISHLI